MNIQLGNKAYETMKWLVQIVLPAFGTLYFALASIWGLPNADKVVGTIAAITTFLGVIMKISAVNYTGEGTLHIDTSDPSKDVYHLDLDVPIEDLSTMNSVTFKVNNKEA